jgi:G:T-mismatch repair DNA endonuclease (very short patch repair protein)
LAASAANFISTLRLCQGPKCADVQGFNEEMVMAEYSLHIEITGHIWQGHRCHHEATVAAGASEADLYALTK